MRRRACLLGLALLVFACGQEKTIVYVYPDGYTPQDARDDGPAFSWGDTDEATTPGDVATAESTPDATSVPDAPVPDAIAPADLGVGDLAEYWPEGVEPLPEVIDPIEVSVPDAPTHDCAPLGIPEQWEGSFDGEIVSNIPDFGDYTFNGPVYGDIGFTIACYNAKYIVQGQLNGGASNCALASGCPFVATMSGYYDPATKTITGALVNGSIDFSVVKVLAEGGYDGSLSGTTLSGAWEGHKTGITPTSLDWVTATGEGTWEAEPAE
jgi:hypothetical protein